jgi:hypothetical protein
MNDFFKKRRDWSKYKDFILGYYLDPYVPKVNTLRVGVQGPMLPLRLGLGRTVA